MALSYISHQHGKNSGALRNGGSPFRKGGLFFQYERAEVCSEKGGLFMTSKGGFFSQISVSLKPDVLVEFGTTVNAISLRGRLRTHKVFTKDRCFYHNYRYCSIKSYDLDVY